MKRLALCFLGLTLLTGCGGKSAGPPRYDVSGAVTFDGKPVPAGVLMFRPDASKGNSGPATTIRIVDGAFDTQVAGMGVVPGEHKVTITGYDGMTDTANELPDGRPLFRRYEEQATIGEEATTIDFDVPKSASEPAKNQRRRRSDV
ncbi:hypothetical protein Pan216_46790 [Planctomycetes bacterium Pan216]|uniref:Carboxypeptidase regulatory-like domain-containing protein n=1 Tax=Kolteria novifilia TaxID=2527975 RepID=A0A518B9Y8_9BACT|nr:hypothetical protein Pan216_46790 [Planctomycetes bacterium Pan216]